tara:strand:+ start:205 stop:657 length:453 start_codon:yes stop_codon:yes gene_type:complete
MEGCDLDQDDFLNKCLQFALDNSDVDDRYAYLANQHTASLDLIDYFSLKFHRDGPSKRLSMKRRNRYLDYNIIENITAIGLSHAHDPEPVDVDKIKDINNINVSDYEAIDVIVILGSDNPSLVTIELQETISCGRSRRSPRVMPRSLDDY